ncbi:ATP-dependent endonuclease [uncultured Corynebacterium sp.]|uniref:ATP-dependent nuclease n=1 Tax=uncultured Corynebacterium sp. TaxID=159447 RepID=UPI0025E484DB|nr:AAA family ATPase [uncultured Corynebacterium sp.]
MYVDSVKIRGLRAFPSDKDTEIPLGSTLTVLAGLNGTGKSTILAILGNSGRLEKSKATHLNGDQFTTELSEVLKFDIGHDRAGSSVSIRFSDDHYGMASNLPATNELSFRSAIQTGNEPTEVKGVRIDRFKDPRSRLRLIPVKRNRPIESEAKLQWPTYYLGLSRLFPVGETDHYSTKSKNWNAEILQEYENVYNHVLDLSQPVKSLGLITSSSARNKKGAGVETDKYGFVSNSAGQDNLGQIILAALSFKNLRNELDGEYRGGLLLIDEVEATLHPVAQKRLMDFLYRTAKESGFQVVLTTHSLTVLDHVVSPLSDKDKTRKVVYLKRTGGDLIVESNPALAAIEADMNSQFLSAARIDHPRIFVEDDAARMVFSCIQRLHFPELPVRLTEGNLSWTSIITMANEFSPMLSSSLVILDPDVRSEPQEKIRSMLNKSIFRYPGDSTDRPGEREILFLPGNEPVETMMFNYYRSPAREFIDLYKRENMMQLNLTYYSLNNMDDAPRSDKELDRHKWWFDRIPEPAKPEVVSFWLENSDLDIDTFVADFKRNYEIAQQFT